MMGCGCCEVSSSSSRLRINANGSKEGLSRSSISMRKSRGVSAYGITGGTDSCNVGLGSLAAGEVQPEDVVPHHSARTGSPTWNSLAANELSAKGRDARDVQGELADSESKNGASDSAGASDAPSVTSGKENKTDADDLMPFQKRKTQQRSAGGLVSRKSISNMEEYLVDKLPGGVVPGLSPKGQGSPKGDALDGMKVGDQVARGSDWKWADEDGGAGSPGEVVGIDPSAQTFVVKWHGNGSSYNHYRGGKFRDLMIASESPAVAKKQSLSIASESSTISRMSTKDLFADKEQTFICLDWDDTLFPTTYVRDDLGLDWQTPMARQRMGVAEKTQITRNLAKCSQNACTLLRAASRAGKVVLVTLARSPWVRDSCANFFPTVGALIAELSIPVVYAQEGNQIAYDKNAMSSCEEIEQYWSRVKGTAIEKELNTFYSQYDGQSWKNVISIGDSDFERLGTQLAAEGYMTKIMSTSTAMAKAASKKLGALGRQKTLDIGGHKYKVRCKTFKMLDQPTIQELIVQLAMVHKWLPLMVKLDNTFDADLNDLDDAAEIQRIEAKLRGHDL